MRRLLLALILPLLTAQSFNGSGAPTIGGAATGGGSALCPDPDSTISPSLTAHRSSGVAPLAVGFDVLSASNSLGLNSFGDLVHDVDFDDAGSGTWTLTGGDSKNAMRGPITAHLYETPGTYEPAVTSSDPITGDCNSATTSITVTDPDTVFSGTATVCVSTSGTFTDCPAGATQTTSSDWDATFQTAAGTRTLYRRGETFTSSAQKSIANAGPGRVGVFGAGTDRAIVTVTHSSSSVVQFNAATPAQDWAIGGFDFQSLEAGQDVFGKVNAGILQNIVVYDNKTNGGNLLNIGNQHHGAIGMFGNDVSNCDGGAGDTCVFVQANPLIAVGNSMIDSTQAEHVFRISWARNTTIAHNILSTPAHLTGAKHALKFHADSGAGNESEYFNLYRNQIIGKASASLPADIGPQNSSSDERVRYGVIDSNYIKNFDASQGTIRLAMEGFAWFRNNVLEMGDDGDGVSVGKNGSMPAVTQTDFYFANNTCRSAVAATPLCVKSGSASSNREARNNIILSDSGSADAASGTWDTESGSTVKTLSSNPFVTNPPTAWAEYEFANGGSADVTSSTAEGVKYDYEGTARPASPNVGHDEPN